MSTSVAPTSSIAKADERRHAAAVFGFDCPVTPKYPAPTRASSFDCVRELVKDRRVERTSPLRRKLPQRLSAQALPATRLGVQHWFAIRLVGRVRDAVGAAPLNGTYALNRNQCRPRDEPACLQRCDQVAAVVEERGAVERNEAMAMRGQEEIVLSVGPPRSRWSENR